MFVIFYFLLIRPQQKKLKDHREMIKNLRKGDRLIPGGGMHGRVTGMGEPTLPVEIAAAERVKVNRGNITSLVQPTSQAQTQKSDKTDTGKQDSPK